MRILLQVVVRLTTGRKAAARLESCVSHADLATATRGDLPIFESVLDDRGYAQPGVRSKTAMPSGTWWKVCLSMV
jgi:hypothetical protein